MKQAKLVQERSEQSLSIADRKHKNPHGLRVAFAPYYLDENPYQKQLNDYLGKLGIQVLGVEEGIFMPAAVKHIKPNILHLHWLQVFAKASTPGRSFFRLAKFILGLIILKLTGVKIVWTAHNLRDHENLSPATDRLCTSLVIRLADAVIAHGEVAKHEILDAFKIKQKDKVFVIPHGNYVNYYPNKISRAAARELLGIDSSKTVFLFLGIIRPYKGVGELIEIFQQLDQSDVELVVAGKPYNPEIEAEIKQKVQNCSGIKFIPGFVPNDRIQVYMNASDVVVFPYRNLLTSGAAILAMSFGKACLAPRIGCLREALDDSGAFLYDPDAQNALLDSINRAIEQRANLAAMGKYNRQAADQWSWDRIALMTSEVYQRCFSQSA